LLVVLSGVKNAVASRAFRVAIPTIWNALSADVKSSSSFWVFKQRLEFFFINTAFEYSHHAVGRRLAVSNGA
jgi:hypothetical protein